MNKKKCGFNLIELAIVLAIIGGVIAGIWVAGASAVDKRRVNRTIEQVQQIRDGFRGLAASRSMGVSCDQWSDCSLIPIAIRANILPNDMVNNWAPGQVDYNSAHNLWGGGFYLSYGRYWVSPTSNVNTLFVNFEPISAGACPRLALALIVNQPDVVYYSIDNANGITPPPYGTGAALTPQLAASQCAAATTNHIHVLYKL